MMGAGAGWVSWPRPREVWSFFAKRRARRVYIVPTWFAISGNFVILCVVTQAFMSGAGFIAAFGVVFLFIELLSMVESAVNIREIKIDFDGCRPVEAGTSAVLQFNLSAVEAAWGVRAHLGQVISSAETKDRRVDPRRVDRRLRARVSPARQSNVRQEVRKALAFWARDNGDAVDEFNLATLPVSRRLEFSAGPRGIRRIPPVIISSRFPFGMFHCWKIHAFESAYAAYPIPGGVGYLARHTARENQEASKASRDLPMYPDNSEYSHHKSFELGDSVGRIDWRASARRGTTLVKVFTGSREERSRVLKWSECHAQETEARLSELSLWVLEAEAARIPYRLELPDVSTAFGLGDRHRDHCLTVLAGFDHEVPGGIPSP